MGFLADLVYGRDRDGAVGQLINTLSYLPVVGDIIAGVRLTQAIIDQIKNGGKSRDEWLNALTFIPRVGDVIGGVLLTVEIVDEIKSLTNGEARYVYEEPVSTAITPEECWCTGRIFCPCYVAPPFPEGAVSTYDDGTCPEGYTKDFINDWCVPEPRKSDPLPSTYPPKCKRLCQGFENGTCRVPGCEGYNGTIESSRDVQDPQTPSVSHPARKKDSLDRWRSVCCLK
jgi:hypothetical protein